MEKHGLTVEEAEKVLMVAGFKFGPYDPSTLRWAITIPDKPGKTFGWLEGPFDEVVLWAWQYTFGMGEDYRTVVS